MPSSAVLVRVVRRPRQVTIAPPSCFSECVPARVVRRPRQGRPPSSFFVLRVSGVCRPPSPSGSSAVPARVACQALFASAKVPSPPGSSAVPARVACQLSSFYECLESVVRRPRQGRRVPKRRPRQGRPPGSSAVPARVARCFSESPAKLVLRVSGVWRPPSPSGSSAVPAVSASVSPPGSSAVPARSPPKLVLRVCCAPSRSGSPSPPGSPAKLVLRVFGVCHPPSPSGWSAVFRQARFTSVWSLSSAVPVRVARQALFASAKAPSPSGSSAVPATFAVPTRVVRRPRQGRPPSPPGSRQALFASAKAPSPPGRQARFTSVWSLSSAVPGSVRVAIPARVARQALFASAKAPFPSGSSAIPANVARQAELASASPPGSSAGPARVARQAL